VVQRLFVVPLLVDIWSRSLLFPCQFTVDFPFYAINGCFIVIVMTSFACATQLPVPLTAVLAGKLRN
jgi:hypothetical protein